MLNQGISVVCIGTSCLKVEEIRGHSGDLDLDLDKFHKRTSDYKNCIDRFYFMNLVSHGSCSIASDLRELEVLETNLY